MKRIVITLILIVVAALVAVGGFLLTGYLGEPARVTLSREAALLRLAGEAPSDARQIVIVPTFGPLVRRLSNHTITSGGMDHVARRRELELAAMLIGASPVVAWEKDDAVTLVADVRGVRRALLSFAAIVSPLPVGTRGEYVTFGQAGDAAGGTSDLTIPDLSGELFVLHRGGRDRYPPLERPAVSAVTVSDDRRVRISSVARRADDAPPVAAGVPFEVAEGSMITIVFWKKHSTLKELDRFLPVNLQRMAAGGAALTIYDVETGGLLPRPRGLFAVPQTAESLEAAATLFNTAVFPELGDTGVSSRQVGEVKIDRVKKLGATIEVARLDGRILFGFDDTSLERYLRATRTTAKFTPDASWTVHADVAQLKPVVEKLEDHRGLRFAAPKVARSVKQTSSLLSTLPPGTLIGGSKSASGGFERVDLVIAAK